MATIYYLNWDHEGRGDATQLFHDVHIDDPPETLSSDRFDDLYREVLDVESSDPAQIWREWNRGSDQESEAFLPLRYCDRCKTYIEGRGEASTHAAQNHGYEPIDELGPPEYIRGERSMAVGDIVETADAMCMAATIGWAEIELDGDSA